MGEVKTDAIVLRHVDFGESDRMLTLLSPTLGKLSVSARGCRRGRARLTNATEVFCAGEYLLYQKQDKFTLMGCTIKDAFYDLRCDYDRLVEGAHWLRLVDTVSTPGQEQGLLGSRVMLRLWVKVREDWRNRMGDLRTLGYDQTEEQ